jgi:putative ABC transport system permease protein
MVQGRLVDLRQDRAVFINADKPITLDHTSTKRPLKVGDTLSLNDHELVVAGTYRSSSEFFWEPVIFTTYSRAAFLRTDTRKTLTYVLVKVRPGEDIATVAARIKQQTGLSALTSDQFESQTMWWILDKTGILVNFGITIALGFIIGVLVAGQTFFTFVLDNVRHFAALMAMGTSKLTVLRMLVVQVLVITAVGYGLGVGGASVTGAMFGKIGLAFQMAWQIPVFGGLAVLLCCLLAGALGMVRVMRTEPAIVFKG